MRIPIGWSVFCCSHFLPHPKYSEFASEPRGAISVLPAAVSVLPAAVGRDAGPDLTANCIHRSAGFRPIHSPTGFHSTHRPTVFHLIYRSHPIHFPTVLSCIRTIIF